MGVLLETEEKRVFSEVQVHVYVFLKFSVHLDRSLLGSNIAARALFFWYPLVWGRYCVIFCISIVDSFVDRRLCCGTVWTHYWPSLVWNWFPRWWPILLIGDIFLVGLTVLERRETDQQQSHWTFSELLFFCKTETGITNILFGMRDMAFLFCNWGLSIPLFLFVLFYKKRIPSLFLLPYYDGDGLRSCSFITINVWILYDYEMKWIHFVEF